LTALRRAIDVHDVFVTFLGVDPKWDQLRSSPVFDAILHSTAQACAAGTPGLQQVNLLDVSSAVLAARR